MQTYIHISAFLCRFLPLKYIKISSEEKIYSHQSNYPNKHCPLTKAEQIKTSSNRHVFHPGNIKITNLIYYRILIGIQWFSMQYLFHIDLEMSCVLTLEYSIDAKKKVGIREYEMCEFRPYNIHESCWNIFWINIITLRRRIYLSLLICYLSSQCSEVR